MSQADSESHRRRVRSFVLRPGRLTPGQQRALETGWPRWGLELSDGEIDSGAVFGSDAPLVFEIGFGNGDSLVQMASEQPDTHFIGVEVHSPGVGRALMNIEAAGLNNLRLYKEDAVEVLKRCIPPGSLARVQIFFPDPWPKKKHHKRRLIQPEFLGLLVSRLRSGGVLHLATDWEPYAQHMLECVDAAPALQNCAGPGHFSPRPDWRPLTKFEQRGHRLGHGVWDLLAERE